MPATVIAERIGWDRGLTVLKDQARELIGPFCQKQLIVGKAAAERRLRALQPPLEPAPS